MRKLLFILILCCSMSGFSQKADTIKNLILNPSLEKLRAKPLGNSQLDFAIDWYGPQGSSDIYTKDAEWENNQVPNKMIGDVTIYSGNVCGGFFSTGLHGDGKVYRENVETTLSRPLVKGIAYTISFYICKTYTTELRKKFNMPNYDEKSLGVVFTNEKIFNLPDYMNYDFKYSAECKDTSLLNNTGKWTKIKFKYRASGNEKYMFIGNFDDTKEKVYPEKGFCYYLIDSVSVTENLSSKDSIGIKVTHFESEKEGKLLKDTTIIIEKQ